MWPASYTIGRPGCFGSLTSSGPGVPRSVPLTRTVRVRTVRPESLRSRATRGDVYLLLGRDTIWPPPFRHVHHIEPGRAYRRRPQPAVFPFERAALIGRETSHLDNERILPPDSPAGRAPRAVWVIQRQATSYPQNRGREGLPNVAPMTYIVARAGYTIPGARGKSRRREGRCPPHRCGCGAYPRTVRTSDERRAGTPRGEAGRGDVGGLGKTKGGIRERAHRSKHRVAPLFSALRCADMRRAWTSIIVGHGRDRDTGPSPTVLSEP